MPTPKSLKQVAIFKNQTQYQVYLNKDNVIDFTERRLIQYAKTVGTLEAAKVDALLKDYVARKVTVCWRSGKPLFLLISL